MKVVFMGTPEFSIPALQRLMKEHEVVCVYTREPKISGRGKDLCKTPVHLFAEQNGIEVRTPKTLKTEEEQKKFADLKADVAVVAAYGLLLPQAVLDAYPYGCLNIHASLLPRWRGAAPIQRAIEAGDEKSGVTIMQVAAGLDTGDMLLKGETEITATTTGGDLHDKLAEIGADLIAKVLDNIDAYSPQAQDDNEACYAAKLEKSECKIDFRQNSKALCNKIRAFTPYPAMYFEYKGERFKVLEATPTLVDEPSALVGKVTCGKEKLTISCADGYIDISKIQRQGKKPMSIAELLRGFSFEEGIVLE